MALEDKGELSRREFLGRAAAGLGAVAAATVLPGGEAEAQQSANRPIVFAEHDLRGEDANFARAAPIAASKKSVAIVVESADLAVMKSAYNRAKAVAGTGLPVSFLLADGAGNRIAFYAAGVFTGEIKGPVGGGRLADLVEQGLRQSYAMGFDKKQAALESDLN